MTRCLSCLANAITLSLIPVIQSHVKNHTVTTAWEMSSYGATLAYLKKNIPQVHESEFFTNTESGTFINGVQCQDVQNLSFADASIDLITSNQVFEHVPDDRQGYRECYRVLRPNGALIFTVPLYDIEATEQLAAIENGAIRYFSPPEYHGSRITGPDSVLCYWRHSVHDITRRVADAGLTAELVEVQLFPRRAQPSFVIYARKT